MSCPFVFSVFPHGGSSPQPPQLLQLVQRQGKAMEERFHEIRHLRQSVALQRGAGLRGCVPELVVPSLQLLYALDIGGELVRRLDQP